MTSAGIWYDAARNPLRYRLTLAFTLLTGATCALLYFHVPGKLHRQSIDALNDKARTIARITAYSAAPAVVFGDSLEIHTAIASAAEDPDLLVIEITAQDGRRIGMVGAMHRSLPAIEYATPILHDGTQIATVRVTLSTDRIDASVTATRFRFAVTSLILFVVGAISAFGLSMLVTRPLSVVVDAAAKIAQGGRLARVAVTSADEVGQLAATFNLMIDRLDVAHEELRATNATLEHRVERRTAALENEVRERRRAELQLRASEQRFRAIFESAGIGIAVLDADGCIMDANHALETALPPHLRDRQFADFLDASSVVQFEADRRAVVADSAACPQTEFGVIGRDGSTILPMVCTLTGVRDAGETRYLIALLKDVTEQRELEDLYRESQKLEAIGRLAGGVAHDFNNLLTTINGVTDLLLADGSDTANRRDLEDIRRAGSRAAQLTRQLLAFSRRQVLQPQIVQLNDVVADTTSMLRRIIGENIALHVLPDPHAACILADSGQVVQVIMNLVVNARDAMPDGGTISIMTGMVHVDAATATRHDLLSRGPHVQLTVQDTGCGMDAEALAHAFEPFFTTKPMGEGTGLGLATVYGIVRQSNGAVTVSSTPGGGTTFRILLPAAVGEAPSAATPRTLPPSAGVERTGTVLVVEDETNVRSLVTRVLRRGGYDVIEAADGETGLRMASEHEGRIDILLTDVIMPRLGGVELAARMRLGRPDLRIIFMSGYTPDDFRNELLLDREVFLEKPMTPATLLRTVDDLFAEVNSRDHNQDPVSIVA